MQKLYLRQLLPVIEGTVIQGSDQMIISDVIDSKYLKHLKRPHTLIFLTNDSGAGHSDHSTSNALCRDY